MQPWKSIYRSIQLNRMGLHAIIVWQIKLSGIAAVPAGIYHL
ncbi:hypothetical protein PSYJA_14197 [Pseudomonas syringae pv. japonica str. M301072]|uniref:Uncharacterized protein n=1 Tax=Pseudomonas syringae pv. japonica str. M301072 TaxID=629262 RepID=F3FIL8_PSESX|nr:hypothetical protein PSYJA_14197 [Pseudomonas syringae pv. japonica str. M301072]